MMRFDARDVTLSAVFAALYVTINVLQTVSIGNPTIYGPTQLRLADCLIAMAALLGWPVIGGVTLGCFLTNAYYFLGTTDVIFGPVANLLAATTVFLLRRHHFTACVTGALPVGLIVGGYLWIFFSPPEVLNILPAWAAMIISITISSLVSIGGIGYTFLSIMSKQNITRSLQSRGLKMVNQDKGS
jgi:uncharacterized membrane protein